MFKRPAAQAQHSIIVPSLTYCCWTTENFAKEIKGERETTGKVQKQASGFCCLLPFPLPTKDSQV